MGGRWGQNFLPGEKTLPIPKIKTGKEKNGWLANMQLQAMIGDLTKVLSIQSQNSFPL